MNKITDPTQIPFLQVGSRFPTHEQTELLKEYENNEKLFRGKHQELFKMSEYYKKLNPNLAENIKLAVNMPASVTRAYTDLLFGMFPDIKVNEADAAWLDNFMLENDLENELLQGGDAQSIRGVTLLQLWREDGTGKARMKVISAENWFPVVSQSLKDKFDAHVVGWFEPTERMTSIGNEKFITFHADIYFKDYIYYIDYETQDGLVKYITERNTPDNIRNINDFLIVPIYNLTVDNCWRGISDYADCFDLFAELDNRLSQYSKILDKHADPTLLGSERHMSIMYDQFGRVTNKFFQREDFMTVGDDEMKPEYLVWDAKLDATDKHIDRIMNMLYMVTDTSAILFGQFGQGNIPSGSGTKKLLMRTLARKNRKALQWVAGLYKAIKLCYKLETGSELTSLSIKFKSGLPIDEFEAAQIISMRASGKQTMSTERILELWDDLSPEEVKRELERIEDENETDMSTNDSSTDNGDEVGDINIIKEPNVTNGGNGVGQTSK